MSKLNRIIYWIATVWLSLCMLSSGVIQTFQLEQDVEFTERLKYPACFLSILGVWKILGIVAVLLPRLALLMEWAYAGVFFAMSGAVTSHLVAGTANEIFPALLLLVLTVASWHFRPADRRLQFNFRAAVTH